MIRKAWMTMAAAAICSSAVAQEGFEFFDRIPGVSGEPDVHVSLGPAMIGFAAEAARQTDPMAAELMAGLEGVQVRVYQQIDDPAAVDSFVDQASGELEAMGWERIVLVQDGESKVRVYARTEDQQFAGMTALVLSGSEAVFVNIAGRIDPTQLGRLMGAMGMGGMLDDVAFGGAGDQGEADAETPPPAAGGPGG